MNFDPPQSGAIGPLDLSQFLIEPGRACPDSPLVWTELFGNENPVEIEIGSGKGLFLVNAATADPSHNFLGIELARKYAQSAAERVARRGLVNVRVWRGDAGAVMAKLVAPASVRAIHVYFPDPWWKRRHKKRRVFTAGLVASALRALEPGGLLRVASDVQEYFDVMQGLIAASGRFRDRPVGEAKDPAHELDYLTHFERKYRLEGRPIHRADYVLERPGTAEL